MQYLLVVEHAHPTPSRAFYCTPCPCAHPCLRFRSAHVCTCPCVFVHVRVRLCPRAKPQEGLSWMLKHIAQNSVHESLRSQTLGLSAKVLELKFPFYTFMTSDQHITQLELFKFSMTPVWKWTQWGKTENSPAVVAGGQILHTLTSCFSFRLL